MYIKLMKYQKTSLLLITLSLLLIFVGCADPSENKEESEASENNEKASESSNEQSEIVKEDEIELYFIKDTGTEFVKVSETRSVDTITPKETMELFLEGPENEDYFGAESAEIELLDLTITDELLAEVDFSEELYDLSLGHEAESRFVDSIVYTLTQFEGIEKVKILVEGETAEPISGHIDISEPLTRQDD